MNINSKITPELSQILEQLKDIHYPSNSLWSIDLLWPPNLLQAIMFISLIFVIILIIFKVIKLINKTYKYSPKYIAIKQLNIIEQELDNNKITKLSALQQISIILKRCIITANNNYNLTGEKFLEYLNKTGNTNSFTKPYIKELLTKTLYQSDIYPYNFTGDKPDLHNNIKELIKISKTWIKRNL